MVFMDNVYGHLAILGLRLNFNNPNSCTRVVTHLVTFSHSVTHT